MSFNLITSSWLEARRASGRREVIRPCDLTADFDSDPFVALDFERPDWNAAVTEWLIGLLFLVMAPEDADEWGGKFSAPPDAETLSAALSPLVSSFDLDSEGPAAFQDLDLLAKLEMKPPSGLLIDAPGENAEKNNTDLFVKRGGHRTLSLAHAAAALITLQTYAPAGGVGHRTSLRGGGPLTTLVLPLRTGSQRVGTLWDRVWANVPDQGEGRPLDVKAALPWTAVTRVSEKKSAIVTPEDEHEGLAFFACPRRIRLVFGNGEAGRVVVGYRTVNYGANYLAWQHPLSPYYTDKKSGKLPLHPQAGAADYGDWQAWLGIKHEPAQVLKLWTARRRVVAPFLERTLVEAFGYDMDNMKARQWLDVRLPWVNAHEAELKKAVGSAIAGAEQAARSLKGCLRVALYARDLENDYYLPKTLHPDAPAAPVERFWRETQSDFEVLVDRLSAHLADGPQETSSLLNPWRQVLKRAALRVYDETVDLDAMSARKPRLLLSERGKLAFEFSDHSKAQVLKVMNLAPLPKGTGTKSKAGEGEYEASLG